MLPQSTADGRRELGGRGTKRGLEAGQQVAAGIRYILSPYSTTALACRMMILFVLWFSVSFIYYGVSLNATNIRQDMNLVFQI